MIIFNPSKNIVKETKINFRILSTIFTHIISPKRTVTFRVTKSQKPYSYYSHEKKIIAINLNQHKTIKSVVCTLTHEMRHFLQKKVLGNKLPYGPYRSYTEYYKSPEEKDARNFEKMCSQIYTTYKNLAVIEEKVAQCSMVELVSSINRKRTLL